MTQTNKPVFDDPHFFLFAVNGSSREEARITLKKVVREKGYADDQWEEVPPNDRIFYDKALRAVVDMIRGQGWRFHLVEQEPFSVDVVKDGETIRRIIFVIHLKEAKGRLDDEHSGQSTQN